MSTRVAKKLPKSTGRLIKGKHKLSFTPVALVLTAPINTEVKR